MAKNFPEQLSDYLTELPQHELAQLLAQTIAADMQLTAQWQVRVMLADGKLESFKSLVCDALPSLRITAKTNLGRRLRNYFGRAESIFEIAFDHHDLKTNLLSPPIPVKFRQPLSLEQQFEWLITALNRLNEVIEPIDDPNGYHDYLFEQLTWRVVDVFHRLAWPVARKVQWLVEQYERDSEFDWADFFELEDELALAFEQAIKQLPMTAP